MRGKAAASQPGRAGRSHIIEQERVDDTPAAVSEKASAAIPTAVRCACVGAGSSIDAVPLRVLPPFHWPVIAIAERLAIYLIDVRRTDTLDELRGWLPLAVLQVLEETLSSDGKWLLAAITLKLAQFTMLSTEEQVFDAFAWCVEHYGPMPADQIQIDLHVEDLLQRSLAEHIQRTAKYAVMLHGAVGGEA
jgi:hypothetical protein